MNKLFQMNKLHETWRDGPEREYLYHATINGRPAGWWHIDTIGSVTLEDLRQEFTRMKRIDESFKCLDCGVHTGDIDEYYTVEDEVWLEANPQDYGMLCIGCLETRLGRVLTPADFPEYPINMYLDGKSPRLADRIGL